jgi:hypothetical protein
MLPRRGRGSWVSVRRGSVVRSHFTEKFAYPWRACEYTKQGGLRCSFCVLVRIYFDCGEDPAQVKQQMTAPRSFRCSCNGDSTIL